MDVGAAKFYVCTRQSVRGECCIARFCSVKTMFGEVRSFDKYYFNAIRMQKIEGGRT